MRDEEDMEEDFFESDYKSPEQISSELVTLSLLPESRWKSLIHLDVIKVFSCFEFFFPINFFVFVSLKMRNKPKEPPKAPKAAPFFLPTVAGVVPKFDTSEFKEDEASKVCLEIT